MKKIYLLGLILGTSSLVFAQHSTSALKKVTKEYKPSKQTITHTTKALGQEVWSDDFSDPNTWTIDNGGSSTSGEGWNINSTVDVWYFENTPFNSTSGGNFAELQNGETDNVPQNVTYTLTTANPIDFTANGGTQDVVLEFEQYGARFNDLQQFWISEDGTNFTLVGDNSDKTVLSQSGGDVYDNPDKVRIVLSQHLSANPSDVWVRFSWTSAFPTSTNNGAWITYGWMIDDVKISTLPDNDISTSGLYYGSEGVPYYQLPLEQVTGIDFSVKAKNIGSVDQTGVVLTATETSAGYTGTSPASSIPSMNEDSLVVTSQFTPTAAGNYKVDFAITADLTDDVPANNAMNSYKFKVGGNIYARDSSTQAENGTTYNDLIQAGLASGNLITKYAVAYDIFQDASITGIDFQFGSEVEVGSEVVGQLLDESLNNVLGETSYYTVQNDDDKKLKTLVFDNPIQLTAGTTYFVAIEMFSAENSMASAGEAPLGSSLFFAGTSWGNLAPVNPTYVIRMNFDPSLSVENNELANLNVSQNFPNPFANETTVLFNLKETANVSYTVVDLTGKVVANVNEGTTMAGEHEITIDGSSFANGVYYLNIVAGDSKVTRKMIVNK